VPRTLRPLLLLCGLALLAPATSSAQSAPAQPAPTVIDGAPLNVAVMPDGRVQAAVDGAGAGEFFYQSAFDTVTGNPQPNFAGGSAGLNVMVVTSDRQLAQSYGNFLSSASSSYPAPSFGPQLTPGNPTTTIVTRWDLPDSQGAALLQLEKTVSYTSGSRQFDIVYKVTNASGAPVSFRANETADLAIRGSDHGIGFLQSGAGAPRFMGGRNQEVGATGGLVEVTPWTHFESNQLGTVSQHASDPTGQGFDDSISSEDSDNAAGVQWDNFYPPNSLPAGQTAELRVGWRFVDTLGLTPISAREQTGNEHVVTVTTGDLNGKPTGNQTVTYAISGANNLSGKVTTGADGRAKIAWIGGAPGEDTLTAFGDLNGSGTRDLNEDQATSTVLWEGPPAPVIGESAGVRPVQGTVKIKLPKGTSPTTAKRIGLHGAASGFVPLTGAVQVPLGSTLDTSRGTVRLLTSRSASQSRFQSGDFKGGLFNLTQGRKNPLTQLSMQGGHLKGCATKVSKGGAARKRSRRLFGNAHGRFRTRGRHSSATVRGTKWSMTDTCAGTLTVVQRGSVVVHDYNLRKNKVVKAGKRYFAKAKKLRKGSKRRSLG
jgi:hypothetical protein